MSPKMTPTFPSRQHAVPQFSHDKVAPSSGVAQSRCNENAVTSANTMLENNPSQAPNRPRRPLTAYNLFFQMERQVILRDISDPSKKVAGSGEPVNGSIVGENSTSTPYNVDEERGDTESPYSSCKPANVPVKYKGISLPSPHVKRRKHRKTHGLIGFKDLSKTISNRWKDADDKTKEFFKAWANEILNEQREERRKAKLAEARSLVTLSHQKPNSLTPTTATPPAYPLSQEANTVLSENKIPPQPYHVPSHYTEGQIVRRYSANTSQLVPISPSQSLSSLPVAKHVKAPSPKTVASPVVSPLDQLASLCSLMQHEEHKTNNRSPEEKESVKLASDNIRKRKLDGSCQTIFKAPSACPTVPELKPTFSNGNPPRIDGVVSFNDDHHGSEGPSFMKRRTGPEGVKAPPFPPPLHYVYEKTPPGQYQMPYRHSSPQSYGTLTRAVAQPENFSRRYQNRNPDLSIPHRMPPPMPYSYASNESVISHTSSANSSPDRPRWSTAPPSMTFRSSSPQEVSRFHPDSSSSLRRGSPSKHLYPHPPVQPSGSMPALSSGVTGFYREGRDDLERVRGAISSGHYLSHPHAALAVRTDSQAYPR